MSQIVVLKKFEDSIVNFLDALVEQFPNEEDFHLMKIIISTKQIPVTIIVEKFIEIIYPNKQMIKNRDEKFFLNNESIFSGVSVNKVNHFKKLWMSEYFYDSDKESLWNWFDLFISLCDSYIKYSNK